MSSVTLTAAGAAISPVAGSPEDRWAAAVEALAAEQIDVASEAAPGPVSAPAADPDSLVRSLATAIVRDAAARQNGLAPLYANLEAALARPGTEIPRAVRNAAEVLLGLRLDPGETLDADAIRTALAQAGLALTADADGGAAPAASDLETALLSLREALQSWAEAATPASDSAPEPQAAEQSSATARAAPLPPYRNAPTVAQAPAEASLPAEAEPRALALNLLAATDAALARHTLLQIASLPDGPAGGAQADQSPTRATFDIPFVAPPGTGVIQIRIEREAPRRQGRDVRPAWRASFSIDFEPIGQVDASIALMGERAAVSIRAERPESVDRLRSSVALLEAGLREAALDPGDIHFRGPTAAEPAAPGLFVDQAS